VGRKDLFDRERRILKWYAVVGQKPTNRTIPASACSWFPAGGCRGTRIVETWDHLGLRRQRQPWNIIFDDRRVPLSTMKSIVRRPGGMAGA